MLVTCVLVICVLVISELVICVLVICVLVICVLVIMWGKSYSPSDRTKLILIKLGIQIAFVTPQKVAMSLECHLGKDSEA